MKVHLLAVGTRMPGWVETAYADYAARLPRECRLVLKEIAPADRGGNADTARLKQTEGERLLKALKSLGGSPRVVALDEHGEQLDSGQWSRALQRGMQSAQDLCLLVGGPDGHAADVLEAAAQRWSLSRLTLPHALVRVLVAEQVYRAWSMLANHPYHRA